MKLFLLMAMTADGFIAKDENQTSMEWTSGADKKIFVEETKKHGVVIIGRKTFNTIGRPLPGRLTVVMTSNPELYKEKQKEGSLEFVQGSPAEILQMLEKKGYKSAVLGGGAKTNAQFLKENLVDEILLTVEPVLFGNGVRVIEGIPLETNLELLDIKKITENTLQLHYLVKK